MKIYAWSFIKIVLSSLAVVYYNSILEILYGDVWVLFDLKHFPSSRFFLKKIRISFLEKYCFSCNFYIFPFFLKCCLNLYINFHLYPYFTTENLNFFVTQDSIWANFFFYLLQWGKKTFLHTYITFMGNSQNSGS